MRSVVSCLVAFCMLCPAIVMCSEADSVETMTLDREAVGPRVEGGEEDGFFHWVIHFIRDYVTGKILDWLLERWWNTPPPEFVNSPGWSETGCGMGAAGGSRY